MGIVLVSGEWRVEAVSLDHGTGRRPWIEVRHGSERYCCATVAQLQDLLHRHGLDVGDLVPAGHLPALDDPDDGYE